MHTRIIKANPENPSPDAVREGSEIIKRGGLVVFPTETVYGLGANALNSDACGRIYQAKGRPSDNPLIVHISSMDMIWKVAENVPESIIEKINELWPGPLTLLLRKSSQIPLKVTGGSEYIAVRMPDCKLALDLITMSGVPLAAPSANVSGRPSIVNGLDALTYLEGKVDLIYDSGNTRYGLESTILDVSGKVPVLLRPGSYGIEFLEKYFGKITLLETLKISERRDIPITPGMKYRHYSPDKPLYLVDNPAIMNDIADGKYGENISLIAPEELCRKSKVPCVSLGDGSDLNIVASRLFQALNAVDHTEGSVAFAPTFPLNGIGLAIMNRLTKASISTISDGKQVITVIEKGSNFHHSENPDKMN
ncbi:L-threonylcarbamoyladenylate synthase [Oxyplasma meridianum]|uniref:Threonylcarbamoyl-AMP synthase n=1 Tax=Oxyplasma meridianum TaxID=3073602 RepID=A0AAX4NHJ8_9ARCH